jgi:hypothetical protein
MNFEWTFRAGDLLTFVGGVVVAATFLYNRGRRDSRLEEAMTLCLKEISQIKSELSEFSKAITQLAVQKERMDGMSDRLNMMDRRYDEIRHGDGFVRGPSGIDREYK